MKTKIKKNILKGVELITHHSFEDDRGKFRKIFCKNQFKKILKEEIKQINISTSKKVGTVRGFHYKSIKEDEKKIVTCLRGKIYDVVIDLRKNSSTFLKFFTIELSEDDNFSLLIPKGFAHGFQSLIRDSQVLYCHTNIYKPKYEKGINVMDNHLNVIWPKKISVISDKDKLLPKIKEVDEFKNYL